MLVPVHIGLSAIHGLGIFALYKIEKGTRVWIYQPPIDRRLYIWRVEHTPELLAHLRHFHYTPHGEDYVEVVGDQAMFWNHAEEPNCGDGPGGQKADETFALRNIDTGEELTLDYHSFTDTSHWLLLP